MDKKEKYINYIVEDLVKKTEIMTAPMKVNVGGIWSAYPKHFVDYKDVSKTASIFSSFKDTLKERYGIRDEEFHIIVDKLYPILVDFYNLTKFIVR